METTLTANPRILSAWRAVLVLAALPVAFVSSLVLRPGSWPWWAVTGGWALGFLFCYLYYLPVRQQGLSLTVADERLVLSGGVFVRFERSAAFDSVQYMRVSTGPLRRRLGLSTLIAVCAGGHIMMPGLKTEEADRLVRVIFAEREA